MTGLRQAALLAATLAATSAFMTPALAQPDTAASNTPRQFEPPPAPAKDMPPVTLGMSYDSDLNADVAGGARQGAAYLGKLSLTADADLDRLIGLAGVRAHASLLTIQGTGLSGHFVGNLSTVSGIEAEPAIRLNQLWVDFALPGHAELRVGKFPAAQDFMASDTAAFFINATFGWPASFASDLPSGGPSWPLAAPGAMLKAPITGRLTLSGAVFAGDPAGPGSGDPQQRDGHGFNAFGFAGKPFVIAEAALKTRGAAILKLGGWVHFERFDRIGESGGTAPDNWSVYALADMPLGKRLNGFVRASVAPSDRNPVSVYLDAGLTLSAPFRGRPHDKVGLAFSHSGLSGRLTAQGLPAAERVVELSYSAALGRHVSVQSNVQLIVDPMAPDLSGASADALVLGLRSSITF